MEILLAQQWNERHGQNCETSRLVFPGLEDWQAGLHQIPVLPQSAIDLSNQIGEELGLPPIDHVNQERWVLEVEREDGPLYFMSRITRGQRDSALFSGRQFIAALNRRQPLEGEWQGEVLEDGAYGELASVRIFGTMPEVGEVLLFCEHDYSLDHALSFAKGLVGELDMDSLAS